MVNKIDLSIVIPVYNEGKNISSMYSELNSNLKKINKRYEIIFIDDGSTDNTNNLLEQIHQRDKKVRVIQFQRNFGKSAALSSGFNESKGELIITLDGDLQDDPKEIKNFLKYAKDFDLIVGWKYKRKDPITKRIPSKFFNFLTKYLTSVDIHDSNCGFKLIKRYVIKNIKIYGELHRYIPALAYWSGYKIGEIKVNHRPRKFGKSKFGSARLLKGFFDLITVKFLMTYSRRPLHLFGIFGLILGFFGFIAGLYLFFGWLNGISIGNRPLLILTMLLILMGLQFFSIGLIGEIITFNKDPDYIIKKID